jgi:hypothetical protein
LKKELKAIFKKRVGTGKKAKTSKTAVISEDGLSYTDTVENKPQGDEDLKNRTRAYAVSSWKELIGLKILTVRGCLAEQRDSKDNGITARRLLFNDRVTLMAFLGEAQEGGDTRRRVVVFRDPDAWELVFNNKEDYPEADTDMDGFFIDRYKA